MTKVPMVAIAVFPLGRARVITATIAVTAPGGCRPAPSGRSAAKDGETVRLFALARGAAQRRGKSRPRRCREAIGANSPLRPGETVHHQRPLTCVTERRERENGQSSGSSRSEMARQSD